MAQLLKVGSRVINLDRVQFLYLDGTNPRDEGRIEVYFDYADGEDREVVVFLDGEDGATLRRWLEANVTDAAAVPAPPE